MRIQCPFCRTIVGVEEETFAGKKIVCPNCGKAAAIPATPFDPGCVINDFVIEGIIGRGGMSVVYRAEQLSLSRTVALKILSPKYAIQEPFRQAFLREAKAAARLNHPNIVRALAVGYEEGILFYAMEFVEGKTLRRHIDTENAMDVDSALNVAQQAAEALHTAWTQEQLIHRDVKPDNIMLANDGYAKIMDLGIAVTAKDGNPGDAAGTPAYMAPEQFVGGFLDCRTDIYALGVTLYHCVVGYLPFDGSDTQDVARKHHWEELRFPERHVIDLPPRVRKLIQKMMAKAPEDRFANYDELLEEVYRIRRRLAPENGQVPRVHTISFSKYRRRDGGRRDPGEVYEERHDRKRRVAIAREDAERKPAPTVQARRHLRLGMVIAGILGVAVACLLVAIGIVLFYRPGEPPSFPRRAEHFVASRQEVLEPGSDSIELDASFRAASRILDDFPEHPDEADYRAAIELQRFMLELQRTSSRRAVGRILDDLENKLTGRLKALGLGREEIDARQAELHDLHAQLTALQERLAALERAVPTDVAHGSYGGPGAADRPLVFAAQLELIELCRAGNIDDAAELLILDPDDSPGVRAWKERYSPRFNAAATVIQAILGSGNTYAGTVLPAGTYGGQRIEDIVVVGIAGNIVDWRPAATPTAEPRRLPFASLPAAAVLTLYRRAAPAGEPADLAWSFALCWGGFPTAAALADTPARHAELEDLMHGCFRQEIALLRQRVLAGDRDRALARGRTFVDRYRDFAPFQPYQAEIATLFQTTPAAAATPTTP